MGERGVGDEKDISVCTRERVSARARARVCVCVCVCACVRACIV